MLRYGNPEIEETGANDIECVHALETHNQIIYIKLVTPDDPSRILRIVLTLFRPTL